MLMYQHPIAIIIDTMFLLEYFTLENVLQREAFYQCMAFSIKMKRMKSMLIFNVS